jgi:hypothetical protein
MCLPNTPGHCVLKVMNRDGDAVGPFLTLEMKFTLIKIYVLYRSLCFVLPITLKTKNYHYLNSIIQSVHTRIVEKASICCEAGNMGSRKLGVQ